jgi:uncharacterized membrane protein
VKSEFKEVLQAIIPITLVVILFQVTLIQLPWTEFLQFIIGSVMSIVGLALFLYGVKFGLFP